MQSRLWISGAVIVVLVLIGALLLKSRHGASAPASATTSTNPTATTTYDLGNGITASGPSGAHISVVPIASPVPAPKLDIAVKFSSDLSPDVVAALKTQIALHVAALKKDPAAGSDWLGLALDYKIAGDNKAAEAVWIYMTKVAPTSAVAFQDLGDLYQNYEVNYQKSEANYLAALKLDPHNIDLYRNLYTLYRYQMKEPDKAASIVTQGLKANPNNPDLLTLQKNG